MLRARRTEGCALREQRAYAGREPVAPKTLLSSFVLVRRNTEQKKEMGPENVPPPFRCLMKKKSECKKNLFARYIEYVPYLKEVEEALESICLQ